MIKKNKKCTQLREHDVCVCVCEWDKERETRNSKRMRERMSEWERYCDIEEKRERER